MGAGDVNTSADPVLLRVRWGAYSPGAFRRAVLLGVLAGVGMGCLMHGKVRSTASEAMPVPHTLLPASAHGYGQPAMLLPASTHGHGELAPPPPPPSPPSPLPVADSPKPAIVAICVGGWLELATPRQGASLRDNILAVMPSDVFVAGTLRGNVTNERIADALDGISALAPFAAASVIRMPRPAELREELKKSGHWEDFKIQASKGGSGRFNWQDRAHEDPRLWVPIMMSPALGNPNGNTLQEFHYQSRCIEMINEHEARGGPRRAPRTRYERVMFTRLEFEWLQPHPPLRVLDPRYLWVPTGEDNTGVNDRHWLANRHDAEGVFRRWDALVSGRFHAIFFATSNVRPAFMSSETYNKLHLQYRHVGVARFPNVAALACCDASYAAGSAAAKKGVRCFAKACHQASCPAGVALAAPSCAVAAPASEERQLRFKYLDEGRSALVHATALARPGALWEVADDATPARLQIALPRGQGEAPPVAAPRVAGAIGSLGSGHRLLYTCKTCEGGPDVPDPISINVTSCIFRRQPYAHPVLEAARKAHPCRYFDSEMLAAVCASLGPRHTRITAYGWFCSDVESLQPSES